MLNRRGGSRAAPTTLCQKCLKRGHYSYECTGSQQDRPYISRPSRTQQLLNPKLAPKLSNAKLAEPVASTSKPKAEEWHEKNVQQQRSPSASDSDSVSTISTDLSRSASPEPRHTRKGPETSRRRSPRRYSRDDSRQRRRHSISRSPARRSTQQGPRRAQARSPADRDRSRSPYRRERRLQQPQDDDIHYSTSLRERSLSPYSKRVAMSRG